MSTRVFSDNFLDIFLEYEDLFKNNNKKINISNLFVDIYSLKNEDEKKDLLEYVIFKLIEKNDFDLLVQIKKN